MILNKIKHCCPVAKSSRTNAILLVTYFLSACTPSSPPHGPSYKPSYGTGLTTENILDPKPLPNSLSSPALKTTTQQTSPGFNPDILLGLYGDEVEGYLGIAGLKRREPPAQVWQYPGENCVLHLFLYEKNGGHRVEYYEARNSKGGDETGAACVADLAEARGNKPAN